MTAAQTVLRLHKSRHGIGAGNLNHTQRIFRTALDAEHTAVADIKIDIWNAALRLGNRLHNVSFVIGNCTVLAEVGTVSAGNTYIRIYFTVFFSLVKYRFYSAGCAMNSAFLAPGTFFCINTVRHGLTLSVLKQTMEGIVNAFQQRRMVMLGKLLLGIVVYGDNRVLNDRSAHCDSTYGAALCTFAAASAALGMLKLRVNVNVAVEAGLAELQCGLGTILNAYGAAYAQGAVNDGGFPILAVTHFYGDSEAVGKCSVFTQLTAETAVVAKVGVNTVLFILLTADSACRTGHAAGIAAVTYIFVY